MVQGLLDAEYGGVGGKQQRSEGQHAMKTERRADGWWIVDVPPYDVDGQTFTTCGPYKTKDEADADRAGLAEFQANHPEYTPDAVPTPKDETPEAGGTPQPVPTARLVQRTLFEANP